MPFIAFDVKALEEAPNVARAAHISEDAAIAGLARMWKHCWARKTDEVDGTALEGFFGADASRACITFGFLERAGEGYRVRGADRYLRIAKARSDNGKRAAANGNLKKGSVGGGAPTSPQQLLESCSNSAPVLTPITDHRTTLEDLAGTADAAPPKRKRSGKDANPRHTPLKAKLFTAFREITGTDYGFQGGKDAKGIDQLLSICPDDEEILTRWRAAWDRTGFQRPKDIPDFVSKWNLYALPDTKPWQAEKSRPDPNGGILRSSWEPEPESEEWR